MPSLHMICRNLVHPFLRVQTTQAAEGEKITYRITKCSSLFSFTLKYRPVVKCLILIGWYQLMKPPDHLVRASSNLHNDRAWLITLPPS